MQTSSAPFTLTVHSFAGPELGSGVNERDSQLTVDGATGIARYEQHRSEASTPGEPIGVFSRSLKPEELEALSSAAKLPGFQNLGPGKGGDITATRVVLTAAWGEQTVKKQVSAQDPDSLSQLEPLLSRIGKLEGELLRHPLAAVRLSVRARESRFELVVENLGTQPVRLRDPRFLEGTPNDGAWVRVAAAPPNTTFGMLEWTQLTLVRPADAKGGELHLEPGGSFVAPTEPWHPAKAGVATVAQAMLSSYRGLTPGDLYPVRGAAFSKVLKLP